MSNENMHTPGPWGIGTPPPNGEQTIGDGKGLMVAVATTGPGVDTEANARLIAEAPELADSLRGLIREYEGYFEGAPEPASLIRARAALARVDGEASK